MTFIEAEMPNSCQWFFHADRKTLISQIMFRTCNVIGKLVVLSKSLGLHKRAQNTHPPTVAITLTDTIFGKWKVFIWRERLYSDFFWSFRLGVCSCSYSGPRRVPHHKKCTRANFPEVLWPCILLRLCISVAHHVLNMTWQRLFHRTIQFFHDDFCLAWCVCVLIILGLSF